MQLILARLINIETINFGLFWRVCDSGGINNRNNITKFKIGSLLHRLVMQRKKEGSRHTSLGDTLTTTERSSDK